MNIFRGLMDVIMQSVQCRSISFHQLLTFPPRANLLINENRDEVDVDDAGCNGSLFSVAFLHR